MKTFYGAIALFAFTLVTFNSCKDDDPNGHNSGAPTVTTEAVSNIANTSITASGNVLGGGSSPVTERGFVVSLRSCPGVSNLLLTYPFDGKPNNYDSIVSYDSVRLFYHHLQNSQFGPTLRIISATPTGTGTFTDNIPDLFPDSTYYIRAYARNGGFVAFGVESTFKMAQ